MLVCLYKVIFSFDVRGQLPVNFHPRVVHLHFGVFFREFSTVDVFNSATEHVIAVMRRLGDAWLEVFFVSVSGW